MTSDGRVVGKRLTPVGILQPGDDVPADCEVREIGGKRYACRVEVIVEPRRTDRQIVEEAAARTRRRRKMGFRPGRYGR